MEEKRIIIKQDRIEFDKQRSKNEDAKFKRTHITVENCIELKEQ